MWIAVKRAAKKARINFERIGKLVRQGKIDGIFHKVGQRRQHVQCWVKRESLDHWIAARDTDLAQYLSLPEARRILGLHCNTLVQVCKAGPIRYIQGSERYFRPGYYFFREDISIIKQGFEKHAVPRIVKPLRTDRHPLRSNLPRVWIVRADPSCCGRRARPGCLYQPISGDHGLPIPV